MSYSVSNFLILYSPCFRPSRFYISLKHVRPQVPCCCLLPTLCVIRADRIRMQRNFIVKLLSTLSEYIQICLRSALSDIFKSVQDQRYQNIFIQICSISALSEYIQICSRSALSDIFKSVQDQRYQIYSNLFKISVIRYIQICLRSSQFDVDIVLINFLSVLYSRRLFPPSWLLYAFHHNNSSLK